MQRNNLTGVMTASRDIEKTGDGYTEAAIFDFDAHRNTNLSFSSRNLADPV
jgi:hypothetical protein